MYTYICTYISRCIHTHSHVHNHMYMSQYLLCLFDGSGVIGKVQDVLPHDWQASLYMTKCQNG